MSKAYNPVTRMMEDSVPPHLKQSFFAMSKSQLRKELKDFKEQLKQPGIDKYEKKEFEEIIELINDILLD